MTFTEAGILRVMSKSLQVYNFASDGLAIHQTHEEPSPAEQQQYCKVE